MAVARYWRCTFLLANTSPLSVREVAFLDSVGTDLSIGGTASASSFNTAFVTPDKAFDKNTATAWTNAGMDTMPHLTYDHGAPVAVAQIRIDLGTLGSFLAFEGNIRISSSDDGTAWSRPEPIRLISGSIAANTEAVYVPVPLSSVAGYELGTDHLVFAGSALPNDMPTMASVDGVHPYRDFEFGGFGRIAGTVKEDGSPDTPVKRRVRLHREQDGLLVREVWSHPTTGAYSFDYIDATKQYTVITYDYEHDYRAVIADNIPPEAMP